jgi:hypothetical protein
LTVEEFAPFECTQAPATHDEEIKWNVRNRLAYVFLGIAPVHLEDHCNLHHELTIVQQEKKTVKDHAKEIVSL